MSDKRSLMRTARWAGALNVLSALPDGFSVNVVRKVFVRDDAAATAARILASEATFRLGFVADLVGISLFVASGVLLYRIFKPAGRTWALLYLVPFLMCAILQSLGDLQTLVALTVIRGGAGLAGLPHSAVAYLFLRIYSLGYQLGLFFGAFSSIAMGFLILRSTFVPRMIGPLMMIDGAGFLTFTLSSFLAPAFGMRIYPYIPFATTLIGEAVFYLWLIIKGMNAERWLEQDRVLHCAPS